jgi:hypothetical protein
MTNDASLRGFTHLHVHSHFTLLGATPSIGDLAAQAVADGLSHLALTDTNVLYGAVALRRICRRRAPGVQFDYTDAGAATNGAPNGCKSRHGKRFRKNNHEAHEGEEG